MNSLIPVTNDIHLEKLRSPNGSITVEYRIAHAKYKGTRIGSMEFDLCISKLYDLCEKAFLDLGFFKVADNQKVLEHLPKAIVELIKRRKDFQYLTIELLSIILEYGCHERLQCEGEIHTINIVYIERWVERTWLHPDFRRPIDLYIESSRQLPEVKKLTPEQEEYDICINCLEAFEQYKKTNHCKIIEERQRSVHLYSCLQNYVRRRRNYFECIYFKKYFHNQFRV